MAAGKRTGSVPDRGLAPGMDCDRAHSGAAPRRSGLAHPRPGRPPQLAMLRECQSRYDARMSRRMARYTLLLGQALARQGLYRAAGRAVPILPAVFHAAAPLVGPLGADGVAAGSAPGRDPATGPHHRRPRVGRRRTAAARSGIMHDRSGMEAVSVGARGRFARLLRYVDAELRPMLPGAGTGTGFRRVYRGRLPVAVSRTGFRGAGAPFLAGVEAPNDYVGGNLPKRTAGRRTGGVAQGVDGIRASVLGRRWRRLFGLRSASCTRPIRKGAILCSCCGTQATDMRLNPKDFQRRQCCPRRCLSAGPNQAGSGSQVRNASGR